MIAVSQPSKQEGPPEIDEQAPVSASDFQPDGVAGQRLYRRVDIAEDA